jgi:hypothetical protein
MSQHYFINRNLNSNINKIVFGLDKPTGGYFWQEFTSDDEEVVAEKDGLSLTSLLADLKNKFDIEPNIQVLIDEFSSEKYPTILQINVGTMFNKDVVSMLKEVESDVTRNMILLQAKES